MDISITVVLNFLGSLGLFLVGMKVMSDSLMDMAGNRMRRIMASLTSNRFMAAFTGLFITGLIQSSSATTLMVVSFVNAGLLQLTEALGVIMGANIGTTLTAWLIAVLGFKVSMIDIALPLMILGFLFYMRSDKRAQTIGGFIIGFALLFIGLEFMKNAIPDLQNNPAVFELIQKLNGYGFLSLLLFALLGTILTLVLQSSSATMAITLIAVSQGWLPFDAACAIVLGENIGTTITANLAALVSGVNARRAALAHLMFNIIGVTWVLILFNPFLSMVINICEVVTGANPMTTPADAPIGLAIFHTVFNIVNTTIMIGFIGPLAALVTRMLADQPEKEAPEAGAVHLTDEALKYPQTAIHAALQETRRLYRGPVYESVLYSINIPIDSTEWEKGSDQLVSSSREVLSPDFDAIALNRLQPIYRDLVSFSAETSKRHSLEDLESRQLRHLGYAARDTLLILGEATQLNREVNRNMNNANEHVRDGFDTLRRAVLDFLERLKNVDLTSEKDVLEDELEGLEDALKAGEKAFVAELNRLLDEDRVSADDAASLFNSAALVRSICQHLLRASRQVSDATAAYDEIEIELEEGNEAAAA